MTNRNSTLVGRLWALAMVAAGAVACQAQATMGPPEGCEFHGQHDVEVCHQHCNDNGCHEHCAERERWSHEHHCW
jgi:hypothetical protein